MVLDVYMWVLLFPVPMLFVISLQGFKILYEMRIEEQKILDHYKERILRARQAQDH